MTININSHLRLVRIVHETVLQQEGDAVAQQRVTLHFSEANATSALATLWKDNHECKGIEIIK